MNTLIRYPLFAIRAALRILVLAGVCYAHASTAADTQNPDRDFRNNTIYFLLTDRFNRDGPAYVDPAYPDATNREDCFQTPCETNKQWRSYWGGNLRGVMQKLDYVQNMGISAIWLAPLMQNVPGYDNNGWGTGYHGYWVENAYNVNPYFGSWTDVDQFSSDLHSRGMSYIQDITLNHSNPSDSHVFGLLYGAENALAVSGYATDSNQFYKHYEDDSRCVAAQQMSDSDWSYWQLHHCLLAKLSGYNQDNPVTADYLNKAYLLWMSHGVDGLRLDAVKFVIPDFLADFTRKINDYAAAHGHPAPYIVGEWSGGGVSDMKSLVFANSYDRFSSNILDFQLSYALNRYVGGKYEADSQKMSAQQLGQFLDRRVIAFNGRDTWQGTFIDNHDQVRTMVRLHKLMVPDELERQKRMDLATVLLMTVRGIPIIYYGDEQYLAFYNDHTTIPPEYINTSNNDPYNRIGMRKWDETTSNYKIIQTLAALRKVSPAIARGDYRTLYAGNNILVFLRSYENDHVLVAVNRGPNKTISLKGSLKIAPGQYSNLLQNSGSDQINRVITTDNNVELELHSLSATVIRF